MTKKSAGSGIDNNNYYYYYYYYYYCCCCCYYNYNVIKQNIQLAKELHKTIIKKFRKRNVYSGFRDNIWGADLANMQLISKFNKRFRFLLCVIDTFSKYASVIPLQDKKGVSIFNAFPKILNIS